MEKFIKPNRISWCISLFVFFLFFLQGCKKDNLEVVQLNFTHDFVVVDQGKSKSLDIVIEPADFDRNKIQWHSSDQSVAIIQNGVVTAISDGDVEITASYGDKSAYCHVKVVNIYKIAYSRFNDLPGNTMPHFQAALHKGFNGLKADMRLTLDNKIVLCHDKGYTLNNDGRIMTYDADNYTPIDSLTEHEVLELEFADQVNGLYVHPCSLEEFLILCKRYNLIPYITFRHDGHDNQTADEMYRLLKKYGLDNVAIVNLFPWRHDQVEMIRALDSNLIICDTRMSTSEASIASINKMHEESVGIICYKYNTSVLTSLTDEMIQYADSLGVQIWSWNVQSQDEYDYCVGRGIKGFQIYSRTLWEP